LVVADLLPAYRYKHESTTLKFHLGVRLERTMVGAHGRDQISAASKLSSIANR
jgi:hypothetical protein